MPCAIKPAAGGSSLVARTEDGPGLGGVHVHVAMEPGDPRKSIPLRWAQFWALRAAAALAGCNTGAGASWTEPHPPAAVGRGCKSSSESWHLVASDQLPPKAPARGNSPTRRIWCDFGNVWQASLALLSYRCFMINQRIPLSMRFFTQCNIFNRAGRAGAAA